MTDERDLHELAAPLLADPPHPPPPLDELERRVGRRRQRRARAIGLCSVVAVVLVAAGVLALPRDAELRAGDGSAATPTTQPPPPLEPGSVQIQVSPESAALGAYRIVTITNSGPDRYLTCGYAYDLFRWTGDEWEPAATTWLGDHKTQLGEYDPDRPEGDCGYSTIQPGETHTLPFDPIAADWYSPDGTALMPPDLLAVGWYEVREPAYDGAPLEAVGRFEVTPPGADTDPPIVGPAPIQVAVTPEVAPLDATRTIEVRNTSDQPYTECGLRYDLHRWDGSRWLPVATLNLAIEPDGHPNTDLAPFVVGYDENPPSPELIQCGAMTTIEPGSSHRVTVNFADFADHDGAGSVPPAAVDPLVPSVYELRSYLGASSDLRALGRFEITDPTAAPTTTVTAPPPASEGEPPVSVDLYPLDLMPAGEVLPTTMVVVDQNTIALAWKGPCNQPADRVTFDASDGEVELRLHVGMFIVIDCMGEPDDWVVTFDVPFTITDRVRLVARADGTDGEIDRVPGPIVGSSSSGRQLPDGTPTSFSVREITDPAGSRLVSLGIPFPLADRFACEVSVAISDGIYIPEMLVQDATSAPGLLPSCSDVQTKQQLLRWRLIGQP